VKIALNMYKFAYEYRCKLSPLRYESGLYGLSNQEFIFVENEDEDISSDETRSSKITLELVLLHIS